VRDSESESDSNPVEAGRKRYDSSRNCALVGSICPRRKTLTEFGLSTPSIPRFNTPYSARNDDKGTSSFANIELSWLVCFPNARPWRSNISLSSLFL
jgi:hypothetical protein